MSQGDIQSLIHNAIMQILWLSLPMLGIGLAVGLIISIVQATTQINEQTIVFVAKILSIFVALIIFGPWMLETLKEFTVGIYNSVVTILRS